MNKLLKNAIISIKIGVNDYLSTDPNRVFSCVRNLYSGLILLFKAKLLDLCPADSAEVLIKKNIIPVINGTKLVFKGSGKQTIDTKGIEERFRTLNIKTNWKIIVKIQNERNNIEHYFSEVGVDVLRGLIVDTFNVATDFIKNEIKKEPKDLLKETWEEMLKIKEIFLHEKNKCDEQIEENFILENSQITVIKNIYCNKCGSELLVPKMRTENINDAILKCTNCSSEIKVMEVFEKTIDEVFDPESFVNARYGLEAKIQTCPECGKDTFDAEENICYYCSYEKDYTECQRCGVELSLDEQECEGFCSYCYDQYQKMMEDD